MTVLWRRARDGSLAPYAAQCRPRCPRSTPGRQDEPKASRTMTAVRAGRCKACPRDILPGDVIARVGDSSFHYECSPEDAARDQTWQQERARTRRGVVV